MSDYVVDELLSSPDNVEIVRDQICGILALETAHQYELADEAGDTRKEDYKIKVYLENDQPWELQTEDDKEVFPLVNVSLVSVDRGNGSTTTNKNNVTASFYIDCYATGTFDGDGQTGRMAVVKAWKTARIIRNILCAANYAYLGLRGVVTARQVKSLTAGMPNQQNAAGRVCIVRIAMDVDLLEFSPQVSGVEIAPISLEFLDDTGLVIVDMDQEE